MQLFELNESQMEKIAGAVIFIFSLVFLFVVIPKEIGAIEGANPNPRSLPVSYGYGLAGLSILLYLDGYKKRNENGEAVLSVSAKELKLVLFSLVSMGVCILLFPRLGYLTSTILILAVMIKVFGQKSLKTIIGVSIGVPVVTWLFFTYVLKLMLP
ncbi:MAG: tripartite tricarboxylate transporter TctB family protein [Aminivibrio sp.]|jgi:hypothetical protein